MYSVHTYELGKGYEIIAMYLDRPADTTDSTPGECGQIFCIKIIQHLMNV